MRFQQVIKYINWLIGLALVVLAGAVFWFVWRPQPKVSGSITAPVTQNATIVRDDLGVPHINAGSIEDALFLQGYVTAQDRLWQMDTLRRFASGQLSEVHGRITLEADLESRRLRMRRAAEDHTARLSPEDRRWMTAYARGVNHFIETHVGRYPVEFTLVGYDPRPWSVADSLVIGLQMHRDLTTSWKVDLSRAAALGSGGDTKLVSQLYPHRSGLEVQPGSNAWVISGRHTASGKPILANDPHLEFALPSTWYLVHLQTPQMNVTGSSLPGVPGVIIGHNDRIAWGVTNLHFDVQDIYIERLDPRTGQYVHGDKVHQARAERETIQVHGGRPVQFVQWVTVHGPVFRQTGTQALALRWTAAEPGKFEFPFIQINSARNWHEFRDALRRFHGPGQNFVYADVDGNIGYQATGALPIRRDFDGSTPIDGASGKYEWDGYVPFDDLPFVLNPPDGRIVTANQNPFPQDWKYPVSGEFDPGYRARQIRALLGSREGWRPEDMLVIQKDVYSPFLHFLAQQVVRAKKADSEAVAILGEWNGQTEKDLAAPMIAALTYQQLQHDLARRALGKPLAWESSFAPAVIERLLRERPTEWFQDWDAVLSAALNKALEEGRKLQGSNPSRWRYGSYLFLETRHPILSRIPWLGRYFNIGPEPMSGSSTSVKQTTRRLGPSLRFVADLSYWSNSLANIVTGQSGHILSGHYKDQWKAYWSGKSFPMRWKNVTGDRLEIQPAAGAP